MKKVYTGKSIDEILASAAKEKNCDAEALYYEVKDEKKAGDYYKCGGK